MVALFERAPAQRDMQKETCDIWKSRNPEVTCRFICQVFFFFFWIYSRPLPKSLHALFFWLIIFFRQIMTQYKVTCFWNLNNFMLDALLLWGKKLD